MTGLSPEKRILEATIACIEQDGIDNLTTRKIAEQAGVNVAAINYYFRSKERLVEEVMKMTIQHMQEDLLEIIHQESTPFLQRLENVVIWLIEGGKRFPKMLMAHMYGILVEKRTDTLAMRRFQDIFEHMYRQAVAAYPALPPENVRAALAQVMSAAFFTMLAPDFFQQNNFLVADVDNTGRLARYTAQMFERCVQIEP